MSETVPAMMEFYFTPDMVCRALFEMLERDGRYEHELGDTVTWLSHKKGDAILIVERGGHD